MQIMTVLLLSLQYFVWQNGLPKMLAKKATLKAPNNKKKITGITECIFLQAADRIASECKVRNISHNCKWKWDGMGRDEKLSSGSFLRLPLVKSVYTQAILTQEDDFFFMILDTSTKYILSRRTSGKVWNTKSNFRYKNWDILSETRFVRAINRYAQGQVQRVQMYAQIVFFILTSL